MEPSQPSWSVSAVPHTTNINEASENNAFRSTPYTLPHLFQITHMSLSQGEDIGSEVHPHTLQTVLVVQGRVRVDLGNSSSTHEQGAFIVIPPGVRHNVTNVSPFQDAKLFVTYYPPEHKAYTFQQVKPQQ